MVYKTAQQKILIFLIIATTFITFIAGQNLWKMWAVLPFSLFFVYLVDLLFMNDGDYMYEPNYINWKDVNEPDY
ncbi:UNKNOWN [Stylonychia lemnae]|uniref:Transmembrane protein n=1 Tax=Stylonychia lemnae TaxID=5949 RepID=A0A078B3W2_STYLE|nr:UNKNOWN [Stylonychia lemnae]|eukprot:CDW89179.1 UNKNOWN [Stylonychia lemnae]